MSARRWFRVDTIATHGLWLRLAPSPHGIDLPIAIGGMWSLGYRPPRVDTAIAAARRRLGVEHFDVTASDPVLPALWLDVVARGALARSLWLTHDRMVLGPIGTLHGPTFVLQDDAWTFAIDDAQGADRAAAAEAATALADRPRRRAEAWRKVAAALGGEVHGDTWRLDDGFTIRLPRGAVTVLIDQPARLTGGDDDPPRVRTRVRARCPPGGADRFALIADGRTAPPARLLAGAFHLDRTLLDGYRCQASAPDLLASRLARLRPLLVAAAPHVVCTAGDELWLLWEGHVAAHRMLAPAIDLVARLAADAGPQVGPYR